MASEVRLFTVDSSDTVAIEEAEALNSDEGLFS